MLDLHRHAQAASSAIDSDLIGRVTAYGGGGTGLAITKAAETVGEATLYDWGYWMFGAAILGRLLFDVVKYIRKPDSK